MSYNVWVENDRSSSAEFTYIPSPVRGGNLGFIVGLERGADLWMRGRGEDGVVRHEMTGDTTYLVGGDLPGDILVGPIATTLEIVGHVTTRSIGPLKTFVNMFESGFWVFGDEGEVRAMARGTLVGDAGKLVSGRATAGSKTMRFELPQGSGRPVPPLDAPAREREDLYAVDHYVVAGGLKHTEMPPHRVRASVALEVFENGFPGGANAAGEIEARHVVDMTLQIRPAASKPVFLRWSSTSGFDERSRALLAPPARKKDDTYKERAARDKDTKGVQERSYIVQEERLAAVAAGKGADARREAEIQTYMTEADEQHIPEDQVRTHVDQIKRAYEDKMKENERQRRHLEMLAKVVRERWDAALGGAEAAAMLPAGKA